MTKVFLSPSDQDNNPVTGGGNEQQFAVLRCLAAARELLAAGVGCRVSQTGSGDDASGYIAAVAESNAYGADLHIADHTNATGVPSVKRRGIEVYVYMPDPESVRLGRAIGQRVADLYWGGEYTIRDGGHLYEVNGPKCTSVLLELGYHDNAEDAHLIRTYPVEMGKAVGHGILDYLNISSEEDLNMDITYHNAEGVRVTSPFQDVARWLIENQHSFDKKLNEIQKYLEAMNLKMDEDRKSFADAQTWDSRNVAWIIETIRANPGATAEELGRLLSEKAKSL